MALKGVKFSDEHRRKISEAHKGKKKPWMIGNRHQKPKGYKRKYFPHRAASEETKEKISQANKLNKIGAFRWSKENPSPFQFTKEGFKNPENHPRWKGGITSINQKIRHSEEYKLWRKAVFERDHYTCIWCLKSKEVSGKLEADHIKPFSQFPELRFAIDNGRTLCHECHTKTDTYFWKISPK